MNDNSEMARSWTGDQPAPSTSSLIAADIPPLRLRPVWLGLVLTLLGFLLFALVSGSEGMEMSRSVAALCSLPAFIYYFMIVHRIVRILDLQPGWSVEYTPAAAVWKHFIPILGLFFLYQWPGDAQSYINWRLGRESRAGQWTFLGLLTGFMLRWLDSFVGLFVLIASLYFLYVPLRRALVAVPPTNEPSPGYNGTLGLR